MSEKRKRKNEEVAKEKRGKISRKRQIFFVGAWIISTLVPFSGAVWFIMVGRETGGWEVIRWLVMSVLLSGSVAALQTASLKRILRYPAKGWFLATFIGWLITAAVLPVFWFFERFSPGFQDSFFFDLFGIDLSLLLVGFYWIVPPTFLQWLILRKRVRSAKGWLIANLLPVSLSSVFLMWFIIDRLFWLSGISGIVVVLGVAITIMIVGFGIPGFYLSEVIRSRGGKGQNQAQQFAEHDADDYVREEMEEFDADEDDDLWEDDKPDRQPGRLVWQQA